MSYQDVRAIIEQVIFLETLSGIKTLPKGPKWQQEQQAAVEGVQGRIDTLIAELSPADRYKLQHVIVILRDRLDVAPPAKPSGP